MKGEVKNFSFLFWHHLTTETQSHREIEVMIHSRKILGKSSLKKLPLCLCASVVKCIFRQP